MLSTGTLAIALPHILWRFNEGIHKMEKLQNNTLNASLPAGICELPTHNADGIPIPELTSEQIYAFDTHGWFLIPEVFTGSELKEMCDFGYRLHHEPESIPEHERSTLGGPLQKLIDHPLVVSLLNEFTAHPAVTSHECYGFTVESTNLFYRSPGMGGFGPHNGNGLLRFPGDVHYYNAFPGKGYSPHTRIVWELNEVKKGQGGTLLVTGSHKSVYTAPPEIQNPESDIWSTYGCPPGSLLFFTEALTHSANPWTNTDNDRIAIFNLYSPVDSGYARVYKPHPKLLEEMPPLRRTLFRNRYVVDNLNGVE